MNYSLYSQHMTNQPEYDRSPDYNVIDPLTTAEIDLLPVGEALGEAMGLSPIKALERDVFSGVERVHVLEHTEGIGDAVVALRQARVNATRYPDKQFNVYVPNAVLDLPFALPANVALRSADVRPEDMRIDDDFFMCASPILNASQLMFRDNAGLANIRIDLLRIKKAEEQDRKGSGCDEDAGEPQPCLSGRRAHPSP